MKPFQFFLLLLLLLAGCFLEKQSTQSTARDSGLRLQVDIEAKNLSEDGTRASSQNDELVVLAYLVKDSVSGPELLITEYLVLDSASGRKTLDGKPVMLTAENEICLVLVEIDSDKNKEQVEPVVRVNLAAIRKAYAANDPDTYNKFFGDDDLLGVKALKVKDVDMKTGTKLTVSGLHLFDAYEYSLLVDFVY